MKLPLLSKVQLVNQQYVNRYADFLAEDLPPRLGIASVTENAHLFIL
jgi:hypothetical protein